MSGALRVAVDGGIEPSYDPEFFSSHHRYGGSGPSTTTSNGKDECDWRYPQEGDEVLNPGPHDVILGRGGGTNHHSGNIKFRELVNEHKLRYLSSRKVDKPGVAREVVASWRKLRPSGRFLARRDDDEKVKAKTADDSSVDVTVWYEVGDKKAREKASQVSSSQGSIVHEPLSKG